MERTFFSIEDIIVNAQDSINDFSIKGTFLINSVKGSLTTNGTPYYNLNLKYKTGSLNAKRFTSGQLEFESLNSMYLVGNEIEIEGIYQHDWHSVKITSEKLIKSVFGELVYLGNRDSSGKNLCKEDITLLKNQNDKFDELIKLIQFGTTIQIKSYINDIIRPGVNLTNRKKIKGFKKLIEEYTKLWPEDRRDEFWNECSRTFGRYETIQPAKWRMWASRLFKLLSVLR